MKKNINGCPKLHHFCKNEDYDLYFLHFAVCNFFAKENMKFSVIHRNVQLQHSFPSYAFPCIVIVQQNVCMDTHFIQIFLVPKFEFWYHTNRMNPRRCIFYLSITMQFNSFAKMCAFWLSTDMPNFSILKANHILAFWHHKRLFTKIKKPSRKFLSIMGTSF